MRTALGSSLCGGTRWEPLEEMAATRVVRCTCGLIFVTPQPSQQAIRQVYDEEYYKVWKAQARQRSRIWRRRIARLETLAPPPGRLLDVGCGTGVFLRMAQERGWTVAGTELSEVAVRAAQHGGLSVFAGEIWEAGFPCQGFDVITCWHVIEHVTDPRRVMNEIYRVLCPGGWLLLATPNLDDHIFRGAYFLARGRRLRLFECDERELHLYFFSAQSLRRLAAEVGFDVMQIGFDRGAAATRGKKVVDAIAFAWFHLTHRHWGMALESVARKPEAAYS